MPIQPYSFFMPKKAQVESAGIGIACGQAKGRFRRFVFPGANIVKEVPQMAKAGARVKITLRCNECKQRNYNTTQEQEELPPTLRDEQVLPLLQEAHRPHRNQVIRKGC